MIQFKFLYELSFPGCTIRVDLVGVVIVIAVPNNHFCSTGLPLFFIAILVNNTTFYITQFIGVSWTILNNKSFSSYFVSKQNMASLFSY